MSDSGGRRIALNKTLTTHLICHVLAHLSQRLIGKLLVYPWSGVRPSIRPSFTMLRHFLLRNRVANQSQILYGATLGWGKKVCSRQLGHMTKMALRPIYGNTPSKNILLRNQCIIVSSNDDPGLNLTYFTSRSSFVK